MKNAQPILNSKKSKVRLTKSPKLLIIASCVIALLSSALIILSTWGIVDGLIWKFGAVLILVSSMVFFAIQLIRISEAYLVADMLIVEPFMGKKIITPLQGVVLKKSKFLNLFQLSKVHVRLDGKKSVHLLYGKCDGLKDEKIKLEELLLQLRENKKVNHKPGSVSSVA